MSKTPPINEEFKAIFDRKLREATEKYEKRLDHLIDEYDSKSSTDEKDGIAQRISRLNHAFNSLKRSYVEGSERAVYDVERNIQQYEAFFEAKLKDEPHEWD